MKYPLFGLFLLSCIYTSESSINKRMLLYEGETVAAALQQLQAQVKELNATHAKDMAELKAAHAKEVADLKAGLNAEKLERCRTGTLNFDHEQCANHQCSQSKAAVFSPPFTKVPVVTFAFAAMDIDRDHNVRIGATVSAVTTSSALLSVNTWADTIVYGSTLNWIACPNA